MLINKPGGFREIPDTRWHELKEPILRYTFDELEKDRWLEQTWVIYQTETTLTVPMAKVLAERGLVSPFYHIPSAEDADIWEKRSVLDLEASELFIIMFWGVEDPNFNE